MYISVKTLRVIIALLYAGLLFGNFSIEHSDDIPDRVKRKVGNISFIIAIAIFAFGAWFGVLGSE